MIYLIDDKTTRQNDYGWSKDKFNQYENDICLISNYEEYQRLNILSDNSIILIHDSFFANAKFSISSVKRDEMRKEIIQFANDNRNFQIVFFSGGIDARKKNANIAYMPVSVLYQNLEIFIGKVKNSDINIDYLFFGNDPEVEKNLSEKLIAANNNTGTFEGMINPKKNCLFRPEERFIQIYDDKNFETKTIYKNSDLSQIIEVNLLKEKYDNIFIPISIGSSLSDFLGLKFATLIRCTRTINQCSNIFIYSYVGYEYLYNNKYFNILKTKNVQLIKHKLDAFKIAIDAKLETLTLLELPYEMEKLKLDVPDNYEDNHSIANEWGIYQLAYNANIDIKEITDFDSEKLNSLYFKWLIAKNGLYEDLPQKDKEENEVFRASSYEIKQPKVLKTIDLTKIPKR
ncbi:MAG TPA: hypothetical protein PLW77_05380 [Bacteroidales bacterium]|nr:hypothetical protein [Bacteroidales bacterium]HQB20771.1 hypothetical protein [Bacteroidales bacterium]